MRTSYAIVLAVLCALVLPQGGSAQDSAVVRRVAQMGRMSRTDAAALVGQIDTVLQANAERGGDRYDPVRQAANQALYGDAAGPGSTREEYDQRLAAVFQRLNEGMNAAMLPLLFSGGRNASVLCASQYGVTIPQCDALIAAGTGERLSRRYEAPADGRELRQILRRGRVSRAHAGEIATKLRELMMGVPGNLRNDARGRDVVRLLSACPGSLSGREAQMRAWHGGPTEAIARCMGEQLAPRGGAAQVAAIFGISSEAAEAFVNWAAPEVEPAPVVAPTPTRQPRNVDGPRVASLSPAETQRQRAQTQLRLGNVAAAIAAYEEAARLEPNDIPTHERLVELKTQTNDRSGVVASLINILRLDAENEERYMALARGYANNNQSDAAISTLMRVLEMNPENRAAREGIRALGGEPPPPPLPETPSREEIIAAMSSLQFAMAECAPQFGGVISFHVTVEGPSGQVLDVLGNTMDVGPEELACMEGVVAGARFPRFTQESLEIDYPFRFTGNGAPAPE